MKTKILLALLLSVVLTAGCATSKGVGSETWYKARMEEIETAYTKKEITKAEYLNLKDETDKIRYSYTHRDDGGFHTGFFFGHGF